MQICYFSNYWWVSIFNSFISKNNNNNRDLVVQVCNPSYLWGWGKRISNLHTAWIPVSSKSAWGCLSDHTSKLKMKTGLGPQLSGQTLTLNVQGPGFKSQCHKEKNKARDQSQKTSPVHHSKGKLFKRPHDVHMPHTVWFANQVMSPSLPV